RPRVPRREAGGKTAGAHAFRRTHAALPEWRSRQATVPGRPQGCAHRFQRERLVRGVDPTRSIFVSSATGSPARRVDFADQSSAACLHLGAVVALEVDLRTTKPMGAKGGGLRRVAALNEVTLVV